jgi:hypothetical protein
MPSPLADESDEDLAEVSGSDDERDDNADIAP